MSATSAPKELERAIQLLKAKQNEYYIEAVKSAMQSEQQRKLRLGKVATHLESKRLEKVFAKERQRERERLQQIQEDHALLLRAKIADWRANGVPPPPSLVDAGGESGATAAAAARGTQHLESGASKPGAENGIAGETVLAQKKSASKARRMSKEALNRLATPRVTVQKVSDAPGRPSTAASGSAARSLGETSQDVQFLTDIFRKQDHARLHRAVSLPALNAENLRAMTETDLLQKKMHLLQQLHGVVSQQERIVTQHDDQCTVRSAVSSWKSSDFSSRSTTS